MHEFLMRVIFFFVFIAFLKCFLFFLLQAFEVNDLLQGLNFSKVLNSLVALSKATEGEIGRFVSKRDFDLINAPQVYF